MKKTLAIAVLLIAALSGCSNANQYGKCVGIDDARDPSLTYKLSVWNIAMGIIFVEMIIPPIVVATDELYCPVAQYPVNPQ